MSSISRISSGSSAAVIAPPSMVSFRSMRKQVVRCRGSSPPWQPRTLIFISVPLVPETLFHLEKLQVFLHLAGIGHEHALRHQRDDSRLGSLVHRLLDLCALTPMRPCSSLRLTFTSLPCGVSFPRLTAACQR